MIDMYRLNLPRLSPVRILLVLMFVLVIAVPYLLAMTCDFLAHSLRGLKRGLR